ncbi:MAG: hypothetical protein ABIH25_04270 [Candidatus Woesearchaeota archaeon]
MSLDDKNFVGGESKSIEELRNSFRDLFKNKYPNYNIILQSPFNIVGQNIEDPNDFVVDSVTPYIPTKRMTKDFMLYLAGFSEVFSKNTGSSSPELNGERADFYRHGILDGLDFRKTMIERAYNLTKK